MTHMSLRCSATMLIVVLAACSNGRGTLTQPPAAPGQVDPPSSPTPTPNPTPTPPPPAPTPPPPPPAAAAGYWFGTVEGPAGRTYGGRALVTGAGEMHFMVSSSSNIASDSEFLVYGNVCCEARSDIELKSKGYLSERENNVRFRSRIEDDELSGDFRLRGDDYEFSLDRSSRYAEPLTLQDLAGTYTRTTTALFTRTTTYTITIDPSGQLNGSHTNGCVYGGTVTIPDPTHNLAKLDVQLSNCRSLAGFGPTDGRYSGLGFIVRDAAAPSVFLHSLIGPMWLGQQATEK